MTPDFPVGGWLWRCSPLLKDLERLVAHQTLWHCMLHGTGVSKKNTIVFVVKTTHLPVKTELEFSETPTFYREKHPSTFHVVHVKKNAKEKSR